MRENPLNFELMLKKENERIIEQVISLQLKINEQKAKCKALRDIYLTDLDELSTEDERIAALCKVKDGARDRGLKDVEDKYARFIEERKILTVGKKKNLKKLKNILSKEEALLLQLEKNLAKVIVSHIGNPAEKDELNESRIGRLNK